MPRGRYQQKQWEDRESAILDALEALSEERGFSTVTMDDLAEQVGISKATLYQHFDSKDTMLVHLMARHEDRFIAFVDSTADQPPIERLCRTVRYLMEGHIFPLRGVVSLGQDDVLPIFRTNADLMARHDQIIEQLTAVITQGHQAGSIAPDLAPYAIISAMIALSNVSMGSTRPPVCTEQTTSNAEYAEQMIRIFERGIRPGEDTQ